MLLYDTFLLIFTTKNIYERGETGNLCLSRDFHTQRHSPSVDRDLSLKAYDVPFIDKPNLSMIAGRATSATLSCNNTELSSII